jgi:YVTN family beta-propeller protein
MFLKLLVVFLFVPLFCLNSQVLIVLNKLDDTIMFLNPDTGELISKLPTGEGPHEVAVSPDGKLAVVTNYGRRSRPGSSLSVYDVKNFSPVKDIELGNFTRPHGIAWIDSRRVIVTVEGNRAVIIVDVIDGRVLRSIRTDQDVSHMVVVTPDKGMAFVANIGSGSVSVIDIERGRLIKNIPTGRGAEGIDITPDGEEVWVSNRADDDLVIIDVDSLKVIDRIKVEGFPIRVKVTGDGERVIVSCARAGEIAIIDRVERSVIRRIKTGAKVEIEDKNRIFGRVFGESPVPIGIAMDRISETLYVANSNADVISVIDLDTYSVIKQIPAGREPDGIVYVE